MRSPSRKSRLPGEVNGFIRYLVCRPKSQLRVSLNRVSLLLVVSFHVGWFQAAFAESQ
ncbi:hypothetical protein [Nostoc sp. MG11]|uniref:hypothetical protein n=1 Tax=Nostoc sp. MG11 TaxID=2721166 RepID=UPI0039B6FD09